MLNEMCFLLKFGLFMFGCTCVLSSQSWSAILFLPDPLTVSMIQMHERETLTRRRRRKPAHLGMTKVLKARSASHFVSFFVIQPYRWAAYGKIYSVFWAACVIFLFLWVFVEALLNEVRAWSSCQTACSIEILPPLMRLKGKTTF